MDSMVKNIVYNKHDTYLNNVYLEKKDNFNVDNYTRQLSHEIATRYLCASKKSTLKMLDVGCGKGFQSLAFSEYFDVSALDGSKAAEELFQYHGKQIDFKCVDLENDSYGFSDNKFDIIFSKSVIEHVINTDHFLKELYRMLKPKGKLVLMTPAWETQYINFFDDYTHKRPFTRYGLCAALEVNEFKVAFVKEFYQLPFIWRYPLLKWLACLIALLPNRLKWFGDRNKPNKLIRFSKETMLLAIATK